MGDAFYADCCQVTSEDCQSGTVRDFDVYIQRSYNASTEVGGILQMGYGLYKMLSSLPQLFKNLVDFLSGGSGFGGGTPALAGGGVFGGGLTKVLTAEQAMEILHAGALTVAGGLLLSKSGTPSFDGKKIEAVPEDGKPDGSKKKGSGTVDSNKLNHIFGKSQHNLDGFLNSYGGNQTEAYKALLNAVQSYVEDNGIVGNFKDIIVRVNGFDIIVRGTVVDGVVKIGTAFIP